jgi:hypothetical protein
MRGASDLRHPSSVGQRPMPPLVLSRFVSRMEARYTMLSSFLGRSFQLRRVSPGSHRLESSASGLPTPWLRRDRPPITSQKGQKLPLSRALFGRRRNHVKAFEFARAVQGAVASQVQ